MEFLPSRIKKPSACGQVRQHRRRSLEQLERFCRYPITTASICPRYTPDVVHDFIDHIAQPVTMIRLKTGVWKD